MGSEDIKRILAHNPSKEDAIAFLCERANTNVLRIDDHMYWEEISKYAGVTVDDFYDDQEETARLYGKEAVEVYGLYNWKLKEND